MTGYPWQTGDDLLAADLNAAIAAASSAIAAGGPFLPISYVATGTTTPRSAMDRAAEVVNVKDFGAIGNGVTDDSPAINAALAQCHTLSTAGTGWTLRFPQATYMVKSPLNFTSFRATASLGNTVQGGNIDGGGSLIYAQMTGIVFDCTDSRWLHFHDLTIQGDATTVPKIGMQLGPAGIVADYNKLTNVNIVGSFTLTAFFNKGSEMFGARGCYMSNNTTGANAFVAIEDGINHWAASSSFVSITQPANTRQTNKGHVWIDCAFQGVGSSGAIWTANIEQYRMIGCYASNTAASGNIFRLYGLGGGPAEVNSADFDCHCETTALAYVFVVTGPAGVASWYSYGLRFNDHACAAQTAIFHIDPGSSITAANLAETDLAIVAESGSATLVDTPSHWYIYARRLAVTTQYIQSGYLTLAGLVANLTNGGSSLALQNGLGVFGAAAVAAKPTVTGSKSGNAALASLLTALASYGLVTDSST